MLSSITAVTLYGTTKMTPNDKSKTETDSGIEAELKEFDGDVTTSYEHEAVIEVHNPTSEFTTETIQLREYYGRELFSGELTLPPETTREYTVLWHVDPPYRLAKKQLLLNVGDVTHEYTVKTHPPIHTSIPFGLPDEVTVGEEIEIPLTLENNGQRDGTAHVVVRHEIATKQDSETVIYGEHHRVPNGISGDNEKEITITYTPEETGNHVFTIDSDLSTTSTSVSVTK